MMIQYIQPGEPNQNAYVKRFNWTYRNELLDLYLFRNLVQWFIISVTYLRGQFFRRRMAEFYFVEENVQIVSGEFPFERFGNLLVIVLELKDPLIECLH